MTDFFDFFNPKKLKRLAAVEEGRCCGCQKQWQETGGLVGVPIQKDYRRLGGPIEDIPETIFLCFACLAEYANTFNHILEVKKDRDKGQTE
jgi:hypothetical protein